jgi:hypothetical protein
MLVYKKPSHGVPGINGNVGGHLLEEARPVHVFNKFVETDFSLNLVSKVNKHPVSTTKQNDGGSFNSSMESKWFDTMLDELKAFILLCIIQSCLKKDYSQTYWSTQSPQRLHSFPQ